MTTNRLPTPTSKKSEHKIYILTAQKRKKLETESDVALKPMNGRNYGRTGIPLYLHLYAVFAVQVHLGKGPLFEADRTNCGVTT